MDSIESKLTSCIAAKNSSTNFALIVFHFFIYDYLKSILIILINKGLFN